MTDIQVEMERLLHKRNRRWRRFLYLFILVPQIVIWGAFFTLVSITIYQEGLSQTLLDMRADGTAEPLLFLGVTLGLFVFQVLFCLFPLKEIKRLEKKADFMMECFAMLKKPEQIAVLEEANNICKGIFSQSEFSFGRECFCATAIAVSSKIRLTYPVILPYDRIARVWCDSPEAMKKKNLYTTGALALSILTLFTSSGTLVMYAPGPPLMILDTNGNQYSLVCDPQLAEEYATKLMDNCAEAEFAYKPK